MKIFKRIFSVFLKIIISVILLVFLFNKVDKKSLFEYLKNADKLLLFFAFCIYFISYILAIFRWEMLLKAAKIYLPFKRIIISFAGGVFFNLFLPSTIGGDLMRSIDLSAHTKRPREVIATVLLDRLSGYIGLAALALSAILLGWKLIQDASVFFSVTIIVALLTAILLVLFNKFLYEKINSFLDSGGSGRFRELIRDLHQEMHIFRHHRKLIVNNLLISLLIQLILPLTFFIIALSLGVKLNIIYFLIFLPIISAITLLPISIGGLGLRDATTIFFFAKAGMSQGSAFAMSLLSFAFLLLCGTIGGLIYVFTIRHRRIQHHQTPLARIYE
ncbi:MAG: lysylphosphatidylglycerol synthase transmembrane domain-containing protein [Candidatus Omnitrophota bacterium]|nr:lysylphosphatidylglycerol synthase transmembrane domain-containing protein [Candidatus Omnitrophota bacterium]